MDILDKIRKLRLERNWTEYQLAEKSGLPQSTISSWYRKNMQPSVSSLEKICAAFSDTKFGIKTNDENGNYIPDLEHEVSGSFDAIDTETGETAAVQFQINPSPLRMILLFQQIHKIPISTEHKQGTAGPGNRRSHAGTYIAIHIT